MSLPNRVELLAGHDCPEGQPERLIEAEIIFCSVDPVTEECVKHNISDATTIEMWCELCDAFLWRDVSGFSE